MFKKGGQVSYEEKEDTLVVHIGGEIDHHSAVEVRTEVDARIIATSPQKVLLELSAVDFMDSSGLGLIMGRYKLMQKLGGELTVRNPNSRTADIFELAGLQRIVRVENSKKEKTK